MSDWKIVVPRNGYNYVLNPSAETTGNYVARAAATVTREYSEPTVQYQAFGLYGYKVVTTGAGDGIDLTIDAEYPVEVLVMSIFSKGAITNWRWRIQTALGGFGAWHIPELVMRVDDDWYWYDACDTDMAAELIEGFAIEQTGAGVSTWYLDGAMVTSIETTDVDAPITYIDGDQPGCEWWGTPHATISFATSHVRSQGFLLDLQADLHLDVGTMLGTGAADHNITTDGMAMLPGAQILGERLERRSFAVGGVIRGTSQTDFHDNKMDLLLALSGQIVPESAGRKQPVQVWYTGTLPVRCINAYYESGLEGNFNARVDPCFWEQNVAVQFAAVDPLWRSVIERSTHLTSSNNNTDLIVMVREMALGLAGWSNFGAWLMPGGAGTVAVGAGGTTTIYAAVWGPDGRLYFGGDFRNYAGVAECDHIAVYDPRTGGISAVGAAGLNHVVHALCFGPDGTLYAGGQFTNADGDANADYLAKIDPDAAVPAWSNVGGGPTAGATVTAVYALCVDINGNLIIGGYFTNWAGDADMDYAVRFDGTNYVQFDGAELNGIVLSVAASPDGYVYFGGTFTTGGGLTLNHIARWLPGTDAYLALDAGGSGVGNTVRAIEVDSTGRRVWIGGDFLTTTGGETVNYICMWNGTNFEALGSGVGGLVLAIALGADDALWVGGNFTTVTGVGACSAIVKFVGSTWCPVDLQFDAVPIVRAIALSKPVNPSSRLYRVGVGFNDNTAVAYYPYGDQLSNGSSWLVYPKVIFTRVGAVTGRLGNIRIGPSGAELYLNYTLQLGETLTIDTDPRTKTVVSSFYGLRPDALLPASDIGLFCLYPNLFRNQHTDVFWHAEIGNDTDIKCFLLWRDSFESQD